MSETNSHSQSKSKQNHKHKHKHKQKNKKRKREDKPTEDSNKVTQTQPKVADERDAELASLRERVAALEARLANALEDGDEVLVLHVWDGEGEMPVRVVAPARLLEPAREALRTVWDFDEATDFKWLPGPRGPRRHYLACEERRPCAELVRMRLQGSVEAIERGEPEVLSTECNVPYL